jgi:uroporphyrinogen decarboxylase
MPSDSRLLKALRLEPVDRPPIWFMRQAGRYLPEYRAVRAQAGSFRALMQNPTLATQVSLQPVQRFGLDAAILFSDILTIPDAMGLGFEVHEGAGVRLSRPLRTAADVARLPGLDIGRDLGYVLETVERLRAALADQVPLIGFAGSPWTLACYMIEGRGGDFPTARAMVYQDPALLDALLSHLTQAVTDYLGAQARAGADCLMLFDTWGGLLTTGDYGRFSLDPMRRVVAALRPLEKPVILFTLGGGAWLPQLMDSGATGVGLDWHCDPRGSRSLAKERKVALQGNLDPFCLYASPGQVAQATRQLLEAFGPEPGYIFNLGHGIRPDTPLEGVQAMVATVQAAAGR